MGIGIQQQTRTLLLLLLLLLHIFGEEGAQGLMLKCYAHTHTHTFNGPFPGTTRVSRYQKGKTDLDFTETRDSEWQWHQPGHMQVCTSLQTDNHASTPPLSFLQAGCPSCRPANSIKALKASTIHTQTQPETENTLSTGNQTVLSVVLLGCIAFVA